MSRTLKYDGALISRIQGARQGVNGELEESRDRQKRLVGVGLHFCKRYKNLVRYNAEFCARCPFNGLRDASATDTHV